MIFQQFVSGPPQGGRAGRGGRGGRGGDNDPEFLGPPMDTPPDASTLGVKILLASLTMLFGATMLAYLAIRLQNRELDWTGYRVPGLGLGLIVSTAILFGVSAILHVATVKAKNGRADAIAPRLMTAGVLALLFLANQTHNWIALHHARTAEQPKIPELLFWILTVVHALHVVGGLPVLIVTIVRAKRLRYTKASWRGLLNCALYWHFLDAIWVVIAIVLWIG